MNSDPVDLRRVHWKEGLFLKPEHFRTQDAFSESLFTWLARYGTPLMGLIGGGPRDSDDSGEAFSLNRLSVQAENLTTTISVERVRGMTPAGAWIDVTAALTGQVPTPDPDTDVLVYVVRRRDAEGTFTQASPTGGANDGVDVVDAAYLVTTRPGAHDVPWSIVVGRIRRRADVTERDGTFVPLAAFVSSHVRLRDAAIDLQGRIASLETTFVELHERLREIAVLARRAAITLSDDYDDMLRVVEQICGAAGDCALALAPPGLPTQTFVDALGLLAARADRTLKVTPTLEAYMERAGVTPPWSEFRRWFTAPLRADENLASRLQAGDGLCHALTRIGEVVEERCEDYRVHRRYPELDLAIDRQATPKQLYVRVAPPVAVEAVSLEDVRFRLTGLSLDAHLSYLAILFGAGDAPLGDHDYVADIVVNDKEQRRDVRTGGSRARNVTNIAVPVTGHGETIRDVIIKVPGGRRFSAAALYVQVSAATTEAYRQARPQVTDTRPPEYVTLKLTGHQSDRSKKVALAGSNQIRVRMSYDRPTEKGGKGTRRLFEVMIVKGQVWSLRLSERDRNDSRLVCRWNESESLMGLRSIYDFPEMPRCLQLGISDVAKGAMWFLKCEFRHLQERQAGRVEDVIAARLQDVSTAWPQK